MLLPQRLFELFFHFLDPLRIVLFYLCLFRVLGAQRTKRYLFFVRLLARLTASLALLRAAAPSLVILARPVIPSASARARRDGSLRSWAGSLSAKFNANTVQSR